MRTHSRRVWPLLAADAVPAILAVFVLDGVIAGVLAFVALLGLIGCGSHLNDIQGNLGGPTGVRTFTDPEFASLAATLNDGEIAAVDPVDGR